VATDDPKVWNGLRVKSPAKRALLGAGLHTLDDVAQWRRDELAALHGVGPRALELIDAALAATGRRYR
jgi:hypothetical protein